MGVRCGCGTVCFEPTGLTRRHNVWVRQQVGVSDDKGLVAQLTRRKVATCGHWLKRWHSLALRPSYTYRFRYHYKHMSGISQCFYDIMTIILVLYAILHNTRNTIILSYISKSQSMIWRVCTREETVIPSNISTSSAANKQHHLVQLVDSCLC